MIAQKMWGKLWPSVGQTDNHDIMYRMNINMDTEQEIKHKRASHLHHGTNLADTI